MAEHPDVRASGRNPLLHLISDQGRDEDRKIRSDISGAKWLSIGEETALPDSSIFIERMAGIAFFRRLGFAFEGPSLLGSYFADAIEELAAMNAEMTIDRLDPDVSIIIPVHGQLPFVLNCLDSLSRHRTRLRSKSSSSMTPRPRLRRPSASRQSRGSATSAWTRMSASSRCNGGAELARGRFIVLLNSDTRVAPYWLDELVGSFDLFGKAALVGSKLFNEDGTLQEAGGILWRDGSAWNYGRDEDPNHPKYCFARQVDYCSGAAIAVPKSVWQRMGGLDRAYHPAYCEDADLAFRLRDAGFEVWFQPLARVLHYEGKSHGRDIRVGVKAYQKVNTKKLARRWRNNLAAHRVRGVEPDQEANRSARERILVIDAGTPTPDRDSGSFITWKMLFALRELGYQITFIPQHNYAYKDLYTPNLQRLGIQCIYAPYIHSFSEALDFRTDFDVVLAYRFNVLISVYENIRRRMPNSRIIFHNTDLHYLREQREAELSKSRSRKIAAAATKTAELRMIASADCNIVHTPTETKIIKLDLPVENIIEFPYIAEVHRSAVPFGEQARRHVLGGVWSLQTLTRCSFLSLRSGRR